MYTTFSEKKIREKFLLLASLDYPWFRWGWTSGHVSRDDSAMIASISS